MVLREGGKGETRSTRSRFVSGHLGVEEGRKYTDSVDGAFRCFCSFHGENSRVVELESGAEERNKKSSDLARDLTKSKEYSPALSCSQC